MKMQERLARAIATAAGHADPDRGGSRDVPYIVDGIRYEEPMRPVWELYLRHAVELMEAFPEISEYGSEAKQLKMKLDRAMYLAAMVTFHETDGLDQAGMHGFLLCKERTAKAIKNALYL